MHHYPWSCWGPALALTLIGCEASPSVDTRECGPTGDCSSARTAQAETYIDESADAAAQSGAGATPEIAPERAPTAPADAGLDSASASSGARDTRSTTRPSPCPDGAPEPCASASDSCSSDRSECEQDTARNADQDTAETANTEADAGADPKPTSVLAAAPERAQLKTQAMAAVAGVYATPHPDQPGLRVSVDLGWTFVHHDKIWTLFGDSWLVDRPTSGTEANDALGYMSLTDFPDAASVEAYIRAHPAPQGQPSWRAAAPPLKYITTEGSRSSFAPMLVDRDGTVLSSGNGHVAMTGFSNGRDDERAGAFAVIFRYAAVECDEAGSCSHGLECDPGLGYSRFEQWNPPCVVDGSSSCVEGPGYCQDRGSSFYDADADMGRAQAVPLRLEVGRMDEAEPARFRTQPWETLRFLNVTSRTVSDFDPSRAHGVGNDYRPASGNELMRSGLFMWGRPNFGGIGAEGRDAQLYLAWVPMPEVDENGDFDWRPRFFAGLDSDGRPQFVEREIDSRPLDLDAETAGEQPTEPFDVVAQTGVTWVPSLQRFVMFYGGELAPEFLSGVFRSEIDKVRREPSGSLRVRFAEHPWGPWTSPRELIAAGSVSDRVPAEGLYAPGGILAHNNCSGATCARYEPTFALIGGNNNGVLYGPNFVDPWTTETPEKVDLYWFLSTWNPYQVVLMKTSMTAHEP